MRVVDSRHTIVQLDDEHSTSLDFDCASDGTPEDVVIVQTDRGAHNIRFKLKVEELERFAEVARQLRSRLGDVRPVCVDHGFIDKPMPNDGVEFTDPCPKCDMKDHAAATVHIVKTAEVDDL